MRPRTTLDWVAFVFLLIGAFSWGYFVTDVNILDVLLEQIHLLAHQYEGLIKRTRLRGARRR